MLTAVCSVITQAEGQPLSQTSWVTVFATGFDSSDYQLSSLKGNQSVAGYCTNDRSLGGQYVGGNSPNSAAVMAGCQPPPHYNPDYTDPPPEYWIIAGGHKNV